MNFIETVYAAQFETIKPPSAGGIESFLSQILSRFLIIAGVAALGFVVYSGILYIISQGDPEKNQKAKRSLLWAVMGTVLIVLSYAIAVKYNSIINSVIQKN